MSSPIHLHEDSIWKSREVSRRHILVIADGAGIRQNSDVYQDLRDQGYELDVVQAGARSFKYPDGWENGDPEHITPRGDPTPDLAGFAHEVCAHIRARPPSLIICGSRGSQVTIGVILKTCWRGPFIAINAGCLTANVKIPRQAFPCFITCGRDYFRTKSPAYSNDQFQALSVSNRRALLVHLPSEQHMPDADALQYVLGKCIELSQERASAKEVQDHLWPKQPMLILELRNGLPPRELWKY